MSQWIHKIAINIILSMVKKNLKPHVKNIIIYLLRKSCPTPDEKQKMMNTIYRETVGDINKK